MQTIEERLTIGNASKYLGVSIDTLRRWEKAGKLISHKSPGGHRYFSKKDLDGVFGTKHENYNSNKSGDLSINNTSVENPLTSKSSTESSKPSKSYIVDEQKTTSPDDNRKEDSTLSHSTELSTTSSLPTSTATSSYKTVSNNQIFNVPDSLSQSNNGTPKVGSKNDNKKFYLIAIAFLIFLIIDGVLIIIYLLQL